MAKTTHDDNRVEQARNDINEQRLSDVVKELSSAAYQGRHAGTVGDQKSRDYVITQFRDIGLQPAISGSYEQIYSTVITQPPFKNPLNGTTVQTANSIGYFPGNDPDLKKEVIIISAHRDHLGMRSDDKFYPGANDDASGISAIFELARAFAKVKDLNKRTIIFIAFGSEEQEKMGSMYLSNNSIAIAPNKNIIFMGSIDMIGYGYEAWTGFSRTTADSYSNKWFAEVYNTTLFGGDKDSYSQEYFGSLNRGTFDYDTGAFAKAGVPERMFGYYDNAKGEVTLNYHSITDTWETVQFGPATIFTRAVFSFLWKVDQDPVPHAR